MTVDWGLLWIAAAWAALIAVAVGLTRVGAYGVALFAFLPLLMGALVERTRVMDVWRQFPNLDPELPEDVLGDAWPRHEAREIFARVYDALGPLAEMRFKQVLAEHDQVLAERACHRTTAAEDAPPTGRR